LLEKFVLCFTDFPAIWRWRSARGRFGPTETEVSSAVWRIGSRLKADLDRGVIPI
jgi:hypothetical protein